jgi:hypothetical protein
MTTKVVNIKTEPCDVYIGRGSIWGNPYKIGKDGTRSEVIAKHKKYILNNRELLSKIKDLRNKKLGCFCKPLQCHGDILAELADNYNSLDDFTT